MSELTDELLPCPFCGKDDSLLEYHNPKTVLHPWYRIECDYCGCKGPGSDHGDHRQEWNARAAIAAHEAKKGDEANWPKEFGPISDDEQAALYAFTKGTPHHDVVRRLYRAASGDEAKDAARYRWLRDVSVPPHNFYLSVPEEFHGVRYAPADVDAYIDAAMAAEKGRI